MELKSLENLIGVTILDFEIDSAMGSPCELRLKLSDNTILEIFGGDDGSVQFDREILINALDKRRD